MLLYIPHERQIGICLAAILELSHFFTTAIPDPSYKIAHRRGYHSPAGDSYAILNLGTRIGRKPFENVRAVRFAGTDW
jgi:hypothetical protein